MVPDKYIGLSLAILSTMAIGTSFVVTKKGLNQASERHGFEGEGFSYLRSPIWWTGIVTLILGECANFAAYAFAPAILVTPLGALSVLIGAVLGSYFLNERLGILGILGCALSLLGAVIIVLHAPPDKAVESVDEILAYAMSLGFLIYCAISVAFCLFMIYRIVPRWGKKNPLVYISICSVIGSISVMSVKALGIALKLTFSGHNQFSRPSTYLFAVIVTGCVLMQMTYFNKALSQFSTSIVNPLYYVTFTTATICASLILFQGFNTTDKVSTVSLLCGFLVIFSGVYLLNMSRGDPDGMKIIDSSLTEDDAIPTDTVSSFQTRRSLHRRRSSDLLGARRRSMHNPDYDDSADAQRGLMRSFDEEQSYELPELKKDHHQTQGAAPNVQAKTNGRTPVTFTEDTGV